MELNAYTKTIQDIFSTNKKYIVPRFQREYSWEKEELLELWNDLISNVTISGSKGINSDYFIGSIVLIGNAESINMKIVDGQQRLTTITILLSALVESFKKIEEEDLAKGLYAWIEGRDVSNQLIFKLENETPKPFFQKNIQYYDKENEDPLTKEERRLKFAYNFFLRKLEKQNLIADLEAIASNVIINDENHYLLYLQFIRTQLLRLKTIYITVSNEDEAYTIFETLNARGINLTNVDLIKNEIFKALTSEHPNDDAKTKWNVIKENMRSREDTINIDRFFRHFWLSKYSFTTDAKIFKSFKQLLRTGEIQIPDFLDTLILESNAYNRLSNPLISDWRQQEEKQIFNSLNALKLFKVTQVNTLILALINKRNDNVLSLTSFKNILLLLENFHFIFSAISSARPSGLESKYSKFAREIRNSNTSAKCNEIIGRLKIDLQNKLPEFETFLEQFSKLKYSNSETRDKKIIQYIFRKLELSLRGTDELEINNITLEHIIPQSEIGILPEISLIGNLLPLDQTINEYADREVFEDKLTYYAESDLKVNEQFIEKYTGKPFSKEEILLRTKELAYLAYNQIWNL